MGIPWRRVALVTGGIVGALTAVLVVRAATVSKPTFAAGPAVTLPAIDQDAAVEHLSGAVRIATVSHEDSANDDASAFAELHAFIATTYPRIATGLQREVVAGASLLFTWAGSDPSLSPLVMMAHMDVVPVEPGTEADWTHPPFSGAIADGYVWGRGTMDDKLGVIGTLEAVESLLADGFEPRRTVLLAFGHDEEVGGEAGAGAIAALIEDRGITPAMVLDEGGVVVEAALPGLGKPAALIGIAEKGFVTLELTTKAEGGHASMPPEHTAIGILAAAIARVEASPFPTHLTAPTRMMLDYLGHELGFGIRLVTANLWLLDGALRSALGSKEASSGVVRTTTAVTVVEGGTKANVLPARAHALINHRTLPGDDVEYVRSRVESVVDDPRVAVTVVQGRNATAVSDVNDPGFGAITRAIAATYPEAAIAPYLVVAGTDARHYDGLSPAVFRFLPAYLGPNDRARLHGTNERVAVGEVLRAVEFYARVVRDFAG